MTIFSREAPKYWAANLPAIPLTERAKRPAITRWQTYADAFPSLEERGVWLATFPDGNIGLPMGPLANLVAVDIDTDDPRIIAALNHILPDTPWERKGAKGMVRIYKWSGERTTRIAGSDGSMICKVLAKGTQIVLPPSIHPDTNRPYVANSNLYDVAKLAPPLPAKIDTIIREALADLGFDLARAGGLQVTKFVPSGARDSTMVQHAGLLARAVARGERSLVEVLGEMQHWVENYVEPVVGDPLSPLKAQQKVIEFLTRDVLAKKGIALPPGWDEGLSVEDKEGLGVAFSETHESWEPTRIIDYLTERRVHTEGDGWHTAIRFALDRMAAAGSAIDEIGQQQILSFISGQTPGLSVASLKRQLKQQTADKRPLGSNHSEIAELLLERLSSTGELRFDAGVFWQWKGAQWGSLDRPFLLKTISEEFGHLEAAKRQPDHNGVLRILEARLNGPLSTGEDRGLNFANGFLTEDGTLREHRSSDGCTYVLPYCYHPEKAGHMPLFNQFLMDCWGADPDYHDKVASLQEAIGATLFGRAPAYQRAILLYGTAGAGKSVLRELVARLIPPGAVSAVPPQDWGDKFLPAQMHRKLLNSAGELSETARIHGDKFKQVVVGEPIQAQHKNQAPFVFRPACAQWFSSNHLPSTRDTSAGFWRRWLVLEFGRTVPTEKRVADIEKVIYATECEAIAAWAVEGFARLCKQGEYTLSASHVRMIETMANRSSPVRHFLSTSQQITFCQPNPANTIRVDELHNLYVAFCFTHGLAKKSMADFFGEISMLKDQFPFRMVPGLGVKDTLCEGITVRQ